MSRIWPSLIGALAFAAPAAPASADMLMLPMCGQPGVTIPVPLGDAPSMPDQRGCKGACHAGCERKVQRHGRGDGSGGNAGDDADDADHG